jgi:hypothetical protein
MPISEGMITMLEDFISSRETSNCPAMSMENLKYGKKVYNKIIIEPGPDYQIIGSEGSGYTCYGIYKSKEDKIYVVTTRTNFTNGTTISSCILINHDGWFGSE